MGVRLRLLAVWIAGFVQSGPVVRPFPIVSKIPDPSVRPFGVSLD